MGTRKIKDAKDLDTGELIYIKGHAKATYMSDGRTVEDAINAGGGAGGGEGALTEAQIAAMGFTKNKGTITEVKMNGVSKGANGIVDLGTVITEHQDISGKQDEITDLGTIRANAALGATALQEHQPIKTIFGQEIVGEGDVLPDYSMKITDAGTYTVESVDNPRIMQGGNIFPLIVDEWVTINYGPSLNVRISSDGILVVSGAVAGIQTYYLASGAIPEEYIPNNIAKLEDIQQSDYDESDTTSKAYIKNRTHYFRGYSSAEQLVADDTTIGTNLASIGEYFKLGNAVYKSADMVGVEFNCQTSGASLYVSVVSDVNASGVIVYYLKHISGSSSLGAPIMFIGAGEFKALDAVYIPEKFATKGYVETQIRAAQKEVVSISTPTVESLQPNKIYINHSGRLSNLTISSLETTTNLIDEYTMHFGASGAGLVSVPDYVKWPNGEVPTLTGGAVYELSIVKTTISGSDFFKAVLTRFA